MKEYITKNAPNVKLGLIAVSCDCFPITLNEKHCAAVKAAYKEHSCNLRIPTVCAEIVGEKGKGQYYLSERMAQFELTYWA